MSVVKEKMYCLQERIYYGKEMVYYITNTTRSEGSGHYVHVIAFYVLNRLSYVIFHDVEEIVE